MNEPDAGALEVSPAAIVHPTAIVDLPAEIGAMTRVWHFVHVMAGARIGRECSLGQGCFVGGGAVIGDRVRIQNGVSVYDGVVLEDDVFCGPGVVFTNVKTPRAHVSRRHEYEQTTVRRGATLGANATLLPGVTVGEHAFVGAGAVVTHAVGDFELVLGCPARPSGWVSRRGARLSFDASGRARCPEIGEEYIRDSRGRVTLSRVAAEGTGP